MPLFERYGVKLVLSGHDHNYQRFSRNGVTVEPDQFDLRVVGLDGRTIDRVRVT